MTAPGPWLNNSQHRWSGRFKSGIEMPHTKTDIHRIGNVLESITATLAYRLETKTPVRATNSPKVV